jgi:hypothetical protein
MKFKDPPKISKHTLQHFRSSDFLPYKRMYYSLFGNIL